MFGIRQLLIATAVSLCLVKAQAPCRSMVVRRDILSLTPQDWDRFSQVVTRMYEDGWFKYFSAIHNREFNNIHGNDMFFPWHRRAVREFEEIGQRYDSNFAVPYWNELVDSHNPAGSAVLSGRYLGGNGWGGCVRNGIQNGWKLSFPSSHCLIREFDRGNAMQPWYSPEYIYSFAQRDNVMRTFRDHIEYTLHGAVHLSIGGDFATYWSPNDFIFFLHHANLDRIWDQWQAHDHLWTFDGFDGSGNAIDLYSHIPVYGEEVGTTMRLGVGRMCFRYALPGRHNKETRLGHISRFAPGEIDKGNIAQSRIESLPHHLLEKWFPKLAKSRMGLNGTAGNSGGLNGDESRAGKGPANNSTLPGRPLEYPAPLTFKWIEMHHLNGTLAREIMKEAREFVDDLNAAKYLSPY